MGLLLPSPLMVYAGFLCLLTALCVTCRDRQTGTRLTSLALLPLLLLRPPLGLDTQLIVWMQAQTTRVASSILHGLHVWHFRSGNILKFHDQSLFVEEACSGIQSLFAVTFIALFIVIVARRRWLPGLCLLCAAFLWAGVMNIVRVLGMAWAWQTWNIDLSSGMGHTIWGYICLVVAGAMIVSTDRLIGFFCAPLPVPQHRSGKTRFRIWNLLFAPISPALAPRAARGPIFRGPSWVRLVPLLAISLLTGQVWASLDVSKSYSRIVSSTDIFTATDLPDSLRDWQLSHYETESRNATNSNGQHSNIWNFQKEHTRSVISCDHAFTGWHGLEHCYISRGWRVEERRIQTHQDWACVTVRLTQPTGEHGFFIYSMFDATGRPVAPPGSTTTASLLDRFVRKSNLGSSADRTYQVQVFVETADRISDDMRSELLNCHSMSRARLREQFVNRLSHD